MINCEHGEGYDQYYLYERSNALVLIRTYQTNLEYLSLVKLKQLDVKHTAIPTASEGLSGSSVNMIM
jgi:hypothetical protein